MHESNAKVVGSMNANLTLDDIIRGIDALRLQLDNEGLGLSYTQIGRLSKGLSMLRNMVESMIANDCVTQIEGHIEYQKGVHNAIDWVTNTLEDTPVSLGCAKVIQLFWKQWEAGAFGYQHKQHPHVGVDKDNCSPDGCTERG